MSFNPYNYQTGSSLAFGGKSSFAQKLESLPAAHTASGDNNNDTKLSNNEMFMAFLEKNVGGGGIGVESDEDQ